MPDDLEKKGLRYTARIGEAHFTMKDLIKKLLDIVRRALANDPDNTAERDRLRAEVAALTHERTELQSLTPEIQEVIDLATAATPPEEAPAEQPVV